MEPESGTGGRGARDTALWTVGGVMLVAGLVLVAALRWSDSAGRALGIALVTGVIALALAVGARFLWTRFARRGGRLVAPSVLVIAGVLSLVVFGIQAVRQGDALRAEPVEAGEAEDCATAEPDPLPTPPDGFTYDAVSAQDQALHAREVELITGSSEITAERRVLAGQAPLGFIVAAPGSADDESHRRVLDRVREIASETGTPLDSLEVGGRPAVLVSADQRVRLVSSSGCHVLLVGSPDERYVRYIARQLLGEPQASG